MTNIEVIQALYRCFANNDHEGFRRLCTPDIEWIQSPGFPNGATRRGTEEIIEAVFEGNRKEWEGFAFRLEELLDAGTHVVAIGQYQGVHHRTKKSMQTIVAHVYELREGRVWRFRMFADTKPMWDQMV